jgi:hypothetical protein
MYIAQPFLRPGTPGHMTSHRAPRVLCASALYPPSDKQSRTYSTLCNRPFSHCHTEQQVKRAKSTVSLVASTLCRPQPPTCPRAAGLSNGLPRWMFCHQSPLEGMRARGGGCRNVNKCPCRNYGCGVDLPQSGLEKGENRNRNRPQRFEISSRGDLKSRFRRRHLNRDFGTIRQIAVWSDCPYWHLAQ